VNRRRVALLIFSVALVTRILFWQATPDREWGWSAYYKGDAPLWLDYARAIRAGQPFELDLPIHPPATAWLVVLFSFAPRLGWVVMGALIPLLVFLAAERSFGIRAATVAGGFCAISTGLMMLSTTIDSETPWLLLVLLSLWLLPDATSLRRLAVWSVLNGLACLFRVDHLLFYLLLLTVVVLRGRAAKALLVSLFFFALPLIPWHVAAWRSIHRFNEEPRPLTPVEEQAVSTVETALRHIRWTPEAERRREELPNFSRRTAAAFILATVYYRGGAEVRGEDFEILREAFGYIPRRLHRYPFVSLYGPLNFALANHAGASGGFDRTPLEVPPPLAGGPSRYPPFLIQGLPPAQLSFVYPPHLHVFNEGDAIGRRWIVDHPRDFARLALRKLAIFTVGATHGVTGYGLPPGLSGVRRAVDLVTPFDTTITLVWRTILLALAIFGAAVSWRDPAVWPWLLFLATRIAVTLAFFGYARQGAAVIPVLAVLIGLALARLDGRRIVTATVAALLLATAIEVARMASRPTLLLDSRTLGAFDPDAADDHEDQTLEVR
jgi:hypothetical protein